MATNRLVDGTVCELLFAHRVKPKEHFPPGILTRLLRLELVEGLKVFARLPLDLADPLAMIRPGDRPPSYDALAYAAEKRLAPPRQYEVYRATQRAANIFGGVVANVAHLQLGHDIQISAVLEAHRKRGVNIENWISEDRLGSIKKLLPKVPDALVFAAPNIIAVEVIGDYPASRIREFTEKVLSYEWTVELW